MAKYLDFDGVKYLWGRITDWVHSLGLSNTEIDSLTNNASNIPGNNVGSGGNGSSGGTIGGGATFNFPKIKIAGVGSRPSSAGSYPQYYVVNGMEYVNRGYVPMLFTKRVKNSHYTSGKKLYGVPSMRSKYIKKQAEWIRYTDIFAEVRDADPNYPGKGMLILRGNSGRNGGSYDGMCWSEYMRYFGLYLTDTSPDVQWCTDIGKVLVPYDINPNGHVVVVLYNKKPVSCFDPWLSDSYREGVWMNDPTAYTNGFWERYRHLTFHFKFGFVENKWGVERYSPKITWENQIGDPEYWPGCGYFNKIPYCRYTLSDVVSNIIDIDVDIRFEKNGAMISMNGDHPIYNVFFSDMDVTPKRVV